MSVSRKRAMRGRLFLALLTPCIGAPAQTVDLVIHNGFEDCWSQALTKPAFLALLQASIEGNTGCVAPSSGVVNFGFGDVNYTVCNTLACSGNTVLGCAVTVHSGAFGGDFGTGAFSAAGSADDVAVPVSFTGAATDTCTITVSNIALTYSPFFYITPDGNNGDYLAYLTAASAVTIDSDSFSGSDFYCNLAASSSVTAQVNAQAAAAATTQMVDQLTATAVGEAVCPLTP